MTVNCTTNKTKKTGNIKFYSLTLQMILAVRFCVGTIFAYHLKIELKLNEMGFANVNRTKRTVSED